jgi:hypothetical protein
MPVDAWGNRAELIVAALSTMDRMNIGRVIEHEINGSMEMLTAALREAMGHPTPTPDPNIELAQTCIHENMANRQESVPKPIGQRAHEEIVARVAGDPVKAYQELLNFYEIASPKMRAVFDDPEYQGKPEYHLQQVLKHGMYLWGPIDTPKPWVHLEWDDTHFDRPKYKAALAQYERQLRQSKDSDVKPTPPSRSDYGSTHVVFGGVIGDLLKTYPARRGPLWYRGRSGKACVTTNSIMIADTYTVLLEKTGGDWSGVASARHQHHGLPAKLSKHDKYSLPSRANPVRIFGEAEVRLTSTTTSDSDDVVSEMLEMSNSPAAHKCVVESILRAEQPSNIEDVLDRSQISIGSSRAQMFVRHALQCAGIQFVYVDHTDQEEIYPADPIGVRADLNLDGDDEDSEGTDVEDNEEETVEDESDE